MIKRRVVGVLLALGLCLSLCSCDLYEVMEALPLSDTTTLPSAEVPMVLLPDGYAYTLLDEMQQANYIAVVQALYHSRGKDTTVNGEHGLLVDLPRPLDEETAVEELFQAVYDDHPEFFYLTGQYGWVSVGEVYTKLRLNYIWDAAERAVKATELEAVVSSLLSQTQAMAPVEKELVFHDALVMRSEYNEAAKLEGEKDPDTLYYIASSPYAALCTGDPVCGGYSRAFQLLLSRAGIPNTAIVNENHTWTMLWLDGEAYHTDVTWDDPTEGEEGYGCFNITDEEIRATRDYPVQPRAVPVAAATTYNYYVMNGWYIDDVYDGTIGDVIRSQIESGMATVQLKFDREEYADAVQELFEEQAFFNAVYALEDDELRDHWYGEVQYLESPELGVLQIYTEE